ncbi:MAG: hypothetical protein COV01_02440 [Candidatus Taylorbacteria bacterium CG10_big_fil_rev_8_21_14_0_10_41_48]|uniref:Uncharacterized protein n=1 Tax=Candidatus Taylorbacteria bacterium CG10_big_fil_rev_8_21_14_0_10_41_48 TaxID=1975024 RepID=A0A2M8LCK2_9BACT|nr:MAG: hypothetical protein COV01_02440 [Candidatus Taylorbacteria bacterium CG10_big_fil_rev_8_21_14_0_10_41_48]
MIPELLRKSQRALLLSTRKNILCLPLSRVEETELTRLNSEADKKVKASIKANLRNCVGTRKLNIGTYSAIAT